MTPDPREDALATKIKDAIAAEFNEVGVTDEDLIEDCAGAVLFALSAPLSQSEVDCTTCRDDPDVCATIPMRHCAKANAEPAAPSQSESDDTREAAARWHDERAHNTPDAFEMEFHQVSAAAIRALYIQQKDRYYVAPIDWSLPIEAYGLGPPRKAEVIGHHKGQIDYVDVRIDAGPNGQHYGSDNYIHPPGEYAAGRDTGFIRGTLAIRNVPGVRLSASPYWSESPRRCAACASPRNGRFCWKCGAETFEPDHRWEEPGLPSVEQIREIAKAAGYAVGVHGSQERDLDLIAAPWTDQAVPHSELAKRIADGISGRVASEGPKPLGRYAYTIETSGWLKQIDLSVCPIASPTPYVRPAADIQAEIERTETALAAADSMNNTSAVAKDSYIAGLTFALTPPTTGDANG